MALGPAINYGQGDFYDFVNPIDWQLNEQARNEERKRDAESQFRTAASQIQNIAGQNKSNQVDAINYANQLAQAQAAVAAQKAGLTYGFGQDVQQMGLRTNQGLTDLDQQRLSNYRYRQSLLRDILMGGQRETAGPGTRAQALAYGFR